MNLHFQDQVPSGFNDSSRVWIYQSSRLFLISEALEIEEILSQFVKDWKSHGAEVKGYANLFFGQFIVFMADETASGVSGCSTDSSVRIIKEIEQKFKVQLFDRQSLAFVVREKIQLLPLSQLNYAIKNDFINGETLYFNNTILTKRELLQNWIIPIKESWLAKRVNLPEMTR
ncbi:MAG: hypothetical protein ABI760_13270 [Ferruginibacter sp.]